MMTTVMTPRLMLIGGGAVQEIGGVLKRLGVRKPMIVSDAFMASSGVLAKVTDAIAKAGLGFGVFTDTVPDPTDHVVDKGLAALKAGDYDGLVAVGGGSPMDTAKAIAILEAGGGHMRDYKVPNLADHANLPIICVPTTAGTGSEVTRFTIVTDSANDEKMLIAGLGCLPMAAIVDYELTLSMPFRLTADTGIDALTHAIEAYVSKRATPVSDNYALTAMATLYRNVRQASFHPDDRDARAAMMLGATQAGLAFSNASVALVHGMSRPIGAFFHVPHGLSNAMLLPLITEFSAPAATARYADCARAMGVAEAGEGDQAAVSRLLDALTALNRDLKVPNPKQYGIDEAKYFGIMETMASQALASGSPGNNPRVPTQAEIVDLYQRAWDAV
ncbi:MAG: iron-containing alcohol dehydrogenase [Elsteraceae bacterium]